MLLPTEVLKCRLVGAPIPPNDLRVPSSVTISQRS
jgi:hypothetical protein